MDNIFLTVLFVDDPDHIMTAVTCRSAHFHANVSLARE